MFCWIFDAIGVSFGCCGCSSPVSVRGASLLTDEVTQAARNQNEAYMNTEPPF